MSITPPSRPRLTRPELEERIRAAFPGRELPAFYLCGIRGYYTTTMGGPGNDRGIYDDALFVVSPNAFAAFNANTDPSAHRPGIASLEPGWYDSYQFDRHNGSAPHAAICQRKGPVVVRRDETENVPKGTKDERGECLGSGLWVGMFGINNHMGGVNGTSSLGCLTVPRHQWPAYYSLAKTEFTRIHGPRWNRERVTIILLPS
jgi:lysozyme